MDSYLRFPDGNEFLVEDIDIRESVEHYASKLDVWGVSYNGKRWRTSGGVFEANNETGVVFVWDMEEKK